MIASGRDTLRRTPFRCDGVAAHGFVLTPGRYVGAQDVEDDGEPFEEKMPRLVTELEMQFAESAKLESAIRQNLAMFSLNHEPSH